MSGCLLKGKMHGNPQTLHLAVNCRRVWEIQDQGLLVTAITVETCGGTYIGRNMKKHFVYLQSSGEALRIAKCFRVFG